MTIHRALEDRAFGSEGRAFEPEDIKILETAFEAALAELKVVDRAGSVATLIAKKIIALALVGERDPIRLRELSLRSLSEK
jgi:hypothetical protein